MFSRLSSRYIGLTLFCFSLLGFTFTSPASASVQDLRSAFLGAEVWTDDLSPEQVNAQLKQHFASVLKTLDQHKASSLLLALRRAEVSAAKQWTKAERRQALITLAIRRQQQIDRLRYYAQRGLFPLNEGHAKQAVPIFVDQQNTHCAVGFLMHVDGRDDSITEIVWANNLVQVMEVNQGGLVDWVLTSGLTQEEAALIQPGYPNYLDASFLNFQTTNYVLNKGGMSLSGLTIKQTGFDIDSSENSPTTDLVKYAWDRGKSELATAQPLYLSGQGAGIRRTGELGLINYSTSDPYGLYIGPANDMFSGLLGGGVVGFPDGHAQMFEIEYFLKINDGIFSTYNFTPVESRVFPSNKERGSLKILSEIYDGKTDELIDELDFSKPTIDLFGNYKHQMIDHASNFIRVKTYGLTLQESAIEKSPEVRSLYFSFEITTVPEPRSISIIILACGLLLAPSHRNSSSTCTYPTNF